MLMKKFDFSKKYFESFFISTSALKLRFVSGSAGRMVTREGSSGRASFQRFQYKFILGIQLRTLETCWLFA